MKRVLLVAPDQPDLVALPEIRLLGALDGIQLSVLNGHVTARDVYDAARRGAHIIHFATHSSDRIVQLSGASQILGPEDVAQVAKAARAELVFFNSCRSGLLSAYAVRHGVDYAIHGNVELQDDEAWKLPLLFYEVVNEQIRAARLVDYADAFLQSDTGEGYYGLGISPEVTITWGALAEELRRNAHDIARLEARVERSARIQWLLLSLVGLEGLAMVLSMAWAA